MTATVNRALSAGVRVGALVVAVLAGALGVLAAAAPVAAAPIVPFAPAFRTNDNGYIAQFGNNLLTCPTSVANCARAQAGTITGSANNNNDYAMVPVDADADPSTLSSSNSVVTFPDGGEVLWAGLYWGARTQAGTGGAAAVGNPSVMRLQVPGAGYQSVTASRAFDGGSNGGYQRGAVVTDLVAAAGPGTYWGADVVAATGRDRYAGWTLVVVFRDPASPLRNLTVFDGFASVARGETITVPVSGFIAPLAGTVQTRVAFVAYEGDRGSDGDRATINSTLLSTSESPGTNFFNSSNDVNGINVTTRAPAYRNMLGFDLIDLGVPGAVPNSATSFNVGLTTGGETYFIGVVSTTIDLYAPDFSTSAKGVVNLDGNDPARPADTLEYTVTYTNTGQDPANGSVATDVLPPNVTIVPGSLTFVNGSGGYNPATRTITAGLGDGPGTPSTGGQLGVDETASFRFRVTVDGTAALTVLSNESSLAYTAATIGTPFTYTTNATTTPVDAIADLTLTKTASPNPAAPGETVTFTLGVTNSGPNVATEVVIEDPLPAGATFVGSASGCTPTGAVVTCDIGTLGVGATASPTFQVSTAASSTQTALTNTASVASATTDPSPADNSATASVPLDPRADLGVVKEADGLVTPGATGTYTVTVTNAGPSDAQLVRLRDTVAGDATVVAVDRPECAPSEDGFSCTFPSLAAGASIPVTLTVSVPPDAPAGTAFTNTANAFSNTPDLNPANDEDSADLIAGPPTAGLTVAKSASPATVTAGGTVTFTVVVANPSGPSTASGVVVTDLLAAGLTATDATSSLGTCTVTAGDVSCAVGDLAPGDNATITVTASVAPDALGAITNTASATSTTPGASASGSATVTAEDVADVAIAKTGNPSPVAGGTQTYEITAFNAGPSVARDVTVTDPFPGGQTLVSVTPPDLCAASTATELICALGTLQPGAVVEIVVVVQVPAGPPPGEVANVATITTSATDPVSTGNSADFTSGIAVAADLAIGKEPLTSPVVAGASISYNLFVLNQGPSITSAVVSDPAPAGVVWTGVDDPRCTVAADGSSIDCDFPDLAVNALQVVTVTGTVAPDLAAGTQIVNSATIAVAPGSAATDPTSGNDVAAASSLVTTEAELTVTKSFSVAAGPEGTPTTFTVVVTNDGPSSARSVSLRDAFPIEAMRFPPPTLPPGCRAAGEDAVCDLGTLAPGESRTLTFALAIGDNVPGPYTNTATATSPDAAAPAVGTAVFTVTAPIASLFTSKQPCDLAIGFCRPDSVPPPFPPFDPPPIPLEAGGPFTYALVTVTLGPLGNPLAPSSADDVVLIDDLPAGLDVETVTPSQGTCSIAPSPLDPARERVTCNLGRIDNLAILEQRDAVVIVSGKVSPTLTAGSSLANTVTVTSPDDPVDPSDPFEGFRESSSNQPIVTRAELLLSKAADADETSDVPSFAAGGVAAYTITVTNEGPSPANDVVLTDVVPPEITLDPSLTDPACVIGDPTTCVLGTLAPGETRTVRVVGQIDPATPEGVITNSVTVTSSTPDPTPAPPAESVNPLQRRADLEVTKSPASESAVAGQQLTYDLTVTNAGPSTADDVTLTDEIPDGLATPSVESTPPGACAVSGATVTCSFGTLQPGDRGTATITATLPADLAPTTLVNEATASTTTDDPDGTNNTATATVETVANADLVASKRVLNDPLLAGEPITFELTLTNVGPSVAVGAEVVDVLAPGLSFVSGSEGCESKEQEGGPVVVCPLGDIPVGSSASAIVTLTAPGPGATIENTVIGGSEYFDPQGADNVATITAVVEGPSTPPPPPPTDSRFVALTPVRILDTRTLNEQVGYDGPKPGAGAVIDLQATGRGGVPADDVTAVVFNLTATQADAAGFVTAWPTGMARPRASSLNVEVGTAPEAEDQTLPNLVTVPVGDGGRVSIYTQSGTHLLADVAGYYEAVSESAEGRFTALEPARLLDTRPASGPVGYTGPKPVAGETVTFPVLGRGGVPANGVASVVLTVTVTEATERGFVTAYPAGGALPWASNLNAEYEDETIANQVIVPVGVDGGVNLYTQSGTHLVAGWFSDATGPSGTSGLFVPITPDRRLDTREWAEPKPAAGDTVTVPGALPEASGIVANLTGTEATAPGWVTAHPEGAPVPWASNLNLERVEQTLSAHVTVRLGADGGFRLTTQSGTHLVADIAGWYRA